MEHEYFGDAEEGSRLWHSWKPDLPVQAWAEETFSTAHPHAGAHTINVQATLFFFFFFSHNPADLLQGKASSSGHLSKTF